MYMYLGVCLNIEPLGVSEQAYLLEASIPYIRGHNELFA